MNKTLICAALLAASAFPLAGCWVAAGAAGAEGAYIASQEKRTAGETIDDQVILASVKSKLLADPDVSGLNINVDVFQGTVKLKGYVKSQREISRAIELAQTTNGVKAVDSRLVLDRT